MNTIVKYASAFDLNSHIDMETRLEYIKQLYYGITYNHEVVNESNAYFEDFKINIKYPAKIDCSVEKLLKEFCSMWPIFNRTWCKFSNHGSKEHLKNFYDPILSNYFIQHPNICSLIFILFSTAPLTGPLKRVFSKLAKICYKHRNAMFYGTIETLFFLSVINIDVTNPDIDKVLQKTKDFLVNE